MYFTNINYNDERFVQFGVTKKRNGKNKREVKRIFQSPNAINDNDYSQSSYTLISKIFFVTPIQLRFAEK